MAATPGNATLLKVSISASATTITQRTSVGIPSAERAAIETTDLDSTDATFIVGIRRSRELTFEINYDPAETTHAYLWTSYQAGTKDAWTVVLADAGAGTFTFDGYLTAFAPSAAQVDGLVRFTGTVRITGAITLTP